MIMNENKEEYVYVMSNPSYPDDMLKIGWTRGHPRARAIDLQTSWIPTSFIIEFVIITPEYEGNKLEKLIHNHIKTYRVNENREFFKISKEELTKILENDLMLEIRQITEISATFDRKKSNIIEVDKIKLLCEELEKEVDEFFDRFKKEKSKLVVKEMNNTKYVYITAVESNQTPLIHSGYEENDERHIRETYHFINRDIIEYKELLDNLTKNYKKIKNDIGGKRMREDNIHFKKRILKTKKKLHNIRSDYVVVK